jgi:hypothetical protein
MLLLKHIIIILISLLFLSEHVHGQKGDLPFTVLPLFHFDRPNTLGLSFAKGVKTVTIFSPGETDNKYHHGVVLFPFKEKLYAQWQSSTVDEDGKDTQVFFSKSTDGENWEKPTALTEKHNHAITTGGGWWSDGNTLVAYINVWPEKNGDVKEGYTECMTSTDGIHWTSPKPVKNINGESVLGVIEQDVHALPGGRLLTAFHMQPGLMATPYYTNDPLGVTGWRAGAMTHMPAKNTMMSREIEPSWFYRNDSAIVMVFRDQQSTFKKLASVSTDNAATWTTPQLIETPDSRAKQSAGNLPDGTAFMVNNPSGNNNRFPLVITLSKDGFVFDRAYLLRAGGENLQALRFNGKYKRPGYSYPKSIVWKNFLYVSYATNKEDVELSRIQIDSLKYK